MLKIFFLFAIHFITFSQSLTTEEIKAYAESMNKDLPYSIPGTKVIMDNVSSFDRNLIFTYKVPEHWYPTDNFKEGLINTLSNDFKKQLSNEKINLNYNYLRNGNVVKYVMIRYTDFNIPVIGSLGDYKNYKSHPKSKGVNLKIKVPVGFEELEATRPNIIKKFNNKENNLVYLFGVTELPHFMTKDYTRKYIFNESSSISAKNFIAESGYQGNTSLVSSRYLNIDKYPAIEIVFDWKSELITGQKMENRVIQWIIFYEDRALNFNAIAEKEKFDTYKNIFYLITNSIVFEDQYDRPGVGKDDNYNFNFNEYVDKFYRELNFFGIFKVRPEKINIELKNLEVSSETYHYHGYSTGYNDDDKIEIVLNKRSWKNFTKAQKFYLIFHELCHDVLNLDDLEDNDNEKSIMYPSTDDFALITMDDFIENFHNLLEKY
tara:strand:- start:287 stop:1585 length:1299 start_codon:yes stop_codon:yes gene_type:complete